MIAEWRLMLAAHLVGNQAERDVTEDGRYASLRPHLLPEVRCDVEGDGGEARALVGATPSVRKVHLLLEEVDRIERNWGLV